MKQYILYLGSDGYVKSREIENGETFEVLAAKAQAAGFQVLREHALVAKDPVDAVNRYEQARKLRGEAKEIYKNVESPEAIEAYTKKMDKLYKEQDEAKAKQERMESSQRMASGEPTAKTIPGAMAQGFSDYAKQGGRVANLAKAVGGVPVDLIRKYELTSDFPFVKNEQPNMDLTDNFGDRLLLPFDNDLAEGVLGDPTFAPSMAIPGVREAKMASLLSKAGKILPSAEKVEKVLTKAPALNRALKESKGVAPKVINKYAVNLADNAIQGTVSGVANPEQSMGENLLIGSGAQAGANLLGRSSKAVGTKLIESTLKPSKAKKQQFSVDKMMGATNPDGTKVIGAFTSAAGADTKLTDAMEEWVQVQMPTIKKLSDDIQGLRAKAQRQTLSPEEKAKLGLLSNLIDGTINDARNNVKSSFGKSMNETEVNKALDIIDMEERRLKVSIPYELGKRMGVDGAGNPLARAREYPDFMSVHEAKKAFGKKAKYDKTDATSGDPMVRDLYRDLYEGTRGTITDAEKRYIQMIEDPKTAQYEATLNFVNSNMDKYLKGKDFHKKYQLPVSMGGLGYPGYIPNVKDMESNSTMDYTNPKWMAMFESQLEQAKWRPAPLEGASTYDKASTALSPILNSLGVVEEANARMDKNNLFGLSNYLAANAAGTASGGDWKAALAGMILPTLTQSMPTGTALYRGGEKLQKGGRYAVPTMIRAIPQEDEE